MPEEIELIEVKRGRFMEREEAINQGYNLWLSPGRPKKGQSFWGAAGLEPIIVLALALWMGSYILPVIHDGVHAVLSPIFQMIKPDREPGFRVIDRR